MSYLTIDDFLAKTIIPEIIELGASKPEVIQEKLDLAEMRIDTYCQQDFNSYEKVVELDGNGTAFLPLLQRIYQLNSVFFDYKDHTEKVKINDDNFALKILSVKPEVQMIDVDYYYGLSSGVRPLFDRVATVFIEGVQNIIVDGKFGWESPPKEVVYCTKKLAEAYCLFAGDIESIMAETGIFSKQSMGGYSYTLKETEKAWEIESTGDPTVDTLLKKYRRPIRRKVLGIGAI
jgi:hypothetical protein